ncbi:MAG: hypothetical protein HKN23_04565 [Verrucomicrobiales bacterium]|nr:hypothetical protein [Verrucomicrobiales bacterium]
MKFNSTLCFAGLLLGSIPGALSQDAKFAKAIDEYIDQRFEAPAEATAALLEELRKAGMKNAEQLEDAIRAPRASYPEFPDLKGQMMTMAVECYHVDYKTRTFLLGSPDLDLEKPVSLVVVGHGGNSSMTPQRAEATAEMYLKAYAPILKDWNAVLVVPSSSRGWGHIGNSLILSSISQVSRMIPVDPDRIYVTGQSMGGHMAFRAALILPDRWGAVSPHSGGYNFVEKGNIANLFAVPGYAVWGRTEPYGINTDNRANQRWAKEHGLDDWTWVEKNGGHTIYQDELPRIAKFFRDHPRNLYPSMVYFRMGGAMKFVKTWNVQGWPEHTIHSETRPLRWNQRHWIEVEPRPDEKTPLEVLATLSDEKPNHFEILTNHVRKLTMLIHPDRMKVDLSKPLSISVNGKTEFSGIVKPDPAGMLNRVREYDDRGRIYHASVTLELDSDQEINFEKELASRR